MTETVPVKRKILTLSKIRPQGCTLLLTVLQNQFGQYNYCLKDVFYFFLVHEGCACAGRRSGFHFFQVIYRSKNELKNAFNFDVANLGFKIMKCIF